MHTTTRRKVRDESDADALLTRYAEWSGLAHCRDRRAVDDHPLFIDYASDDRWKKYDT